MGEKFEVVADYTKDTKIGCRKKQDIETMLFRKKVGLEDIYSGERECLKCEKMFKSKNVKKNRICKACKRNTEDANFDRDHSLLLDGETDI